MTWYTETIYIGERDVTVTVTAATPADLDAAIARALDHWRPATSKHFPKNPEPVDPWPTA